MSGPESSSDEFDWIASLRDLAGPEALNLADDAAQIPSRPGFDLIITKDALVSGVHFLPGDPMDLVARKALRVNLSDLAAKGAKPWGYFLAVAWSGTEDRAAFRRGLAEDQANFGLTLLGGDTVATPGPLTISITMLGWTSAGTMIKRSGAQVGDIVQVSGTIGDGFLGLRAAKADLTGKAEAWLADRYRLPKPRLDLNLEGAHAGADVSDGLIADLGHIAEASGVGLFIDLLGLPISPPARAWLAQQADMDGAMVALATGGDDYELIITSPRLLPGFAPIGQVIEGKGVEVLLDGRPVVVTRAGWRHGKDG
jgi:thiamine-monophosphate kinase